MTDQFIIELHDLTMHTVSVRERGCWADAHDLPTFPRYFTKSEAEGFLEDYISKFDDDPLVASARVGNVFIVVTQLFGFHHVAQIIIKRVP